jgi:hypothetical protein
MGLLITLLAGLLFGAGLTLSQMVNPAKIVGFLDFAGMADGSWDPTLPFVMAGALAVTFAGYRYAFALGRPFAAPRFDLPTRTDIDARLAGGAVLFGIGWGLAGYCPGPALAALAFGRLEVFVFVAAMLLGIGLSRTIRPGPAPALDASSG